MRLDLGGPYRIADTVTGDVMLYNPADQFVGRSFDLYGQFSFSELSFLLMGTEEGHTVIDVGANIGAFTIPLARQARRVVAIEPQRLIFQMLCANVALNGLCNVQAMHAAAGNVAGEAALVPVLDPAHGHNFGGLSIEGRTSGEKVSTVVLDDLDLDACHLVKIDVEGMERQVIQGASRLIREHRPALYVENDRPEKSPALIETILGMGYRAYWHVPPLYSAKNHRQNPENVFPGIVSINLICWHEDNIPSIAERLEPSRVTGPDDTWERFRKVAA